MGVITFNRPKRATPPAMPRGDLLLEPPPEIPPPAASKNFGNLLRMLPMVAGALAMGMMMMGGGMGGRGPLGGIIGGMYAISMLGMMLSQTGRGNDDQAAQLDAGRRDYFRYLGQTRKQVRTAADQQRAAVAFRHPSPETLWTIVGNKRMWERRPDNDDFASIRVSVGPQQFAKRLTPPESQPLEDLEPLTTGALRRFIRTHRLVQSVPLAMNLDGFREIRLVGDEEACRKLAYAMVGQIVTWHAPNDIRLMVAAAPEQQPKWQWVKWLPHLQHPTAKDGVGNVRLFATGANDLQDLAHDIGGAEAPHQIVVVVDGVDDVVASQFQTTNSHAVGIHVTGETQVPRRMLDRVAVLEVKPDSVTLHRRTPKNVVARTSLGRPDQVPMVAMEMLARAMAPYRLPVAAAATEEEDAPEVVFEPPKDYPAMVGVGDPLTLDVRQAWKLRPLRQHLRIPFGNAEDGRPVELDIKEAAQGGMGPHGICIGATGSGKSEFLRTLVLGLAMTHSTEQLNLVLVDFKGGATFLGLDDLPHVSAVITNLEGEMSLVDRMQDAIGGELDRRMEVLRSAGNFKNREDYEIARQAGADIPPMPHLFIVVDEFSELLTARPEFIDLFLQIGRVGRSIAVHQLLASQRLEEGKLKGLDTFLSYRIALRTFSPAESRTVIGVPDAYELPPGPGNGYLKFDTVGMVRFKAAYVSGPWHGSPSAPSSSTGGADPLLSHVENRWVPPVLPFTTDHVEVVEPPPAPEPVVVAVEDEPVEPVKVEADEEEDEETLLGLVVNRLKGHGWPAHKVWLPPLDAPPTMDQLLGGVTEVPGRGLQAIDTRALGNLRAPVALIDRPRHQRRDPMWIDFSGSGGNMAVVGGPQSGKSMALRAAVAGLALTHTPAEVGFYALDFGGGALTSMRDLPHMGSVCGRLDVDRVRRTIAEVTSLRTQREVFFAENGIDSMATYRRGRRDGSIPADRFPTDVFLVVDGWSTVRQEFEEQEQVITNLATGGLGFGIHVFVATNKWSEMRSHIRDAIQSRLELKLGDAFESEINRKIQALVPAGRPGRGISADGLHTLIALPRVDSVESADDVAAGQKAMIDRMNAAWQGPRAAEVRMLPASLPLTALPQLVNDGVNRSIPFGIDELELAPVGIDPVADPHLVVFGAPECGKSNLLKVLLHGITERYTPKEAKIIVIDYRRSLLGEIESEHLIGYAASQQASTTLLKNAADAVRTRLPGPDVSQQQLRDRSWWSGADMFVVVDDYELVATSTGNPMAVFADLVSQAQDVGLHLIMARGMGGAGRTVFSDPLITRMKDAINPALIMSGTKDEGALFGNVRPSPLPPGRGTLVTRSGNVLVQIADRTGMGPGAEAAAS
ncbi:type VII secretion protein EccCa [Aestuariimicrobium ganziense]|uniref:type VII secretion protein EccCa n=1 Tax=Aestuariimicrobium ganziense TaxID=2773677 RepID=UPI001940DE98|nr:type VII secretion protein EccCa [Aestuariimicrobium ganziense]